MPFWIGILFGWCATAAAVIFSVALAIVSAVAAVTAAVASIAWAAAGTVIGAIAPVVDAVAVVIQRVVTAVGDVIVGSLKTVSAAIGRVAGALGNTLDAIIRALSEAVGTVAEPILAPIQETLIIIDNYLAVVEVWLKTTFAPLIEFIDTVDKISGYFMVYKLLTAEGDIMSKLEMVARKAGIQTAEAIAMLMRSIADTATGIMEWTVDLFDAFDRKVVHADDRIKEANRIALAELRAAVDEKLGGIKANLDLETRRFDRDIVRIERRVEDLPHFTGMLIRALK